MIFWLCYIIAWLPLTLLYPTKVIRKQRLPKNEPVLLACNHLSSFDPILIELKSKKKVYFLAKKELFNNNFNSFFLKQFGAIPVDRQKVGIEPIKKVYKLLKNNKPVCIFPQGTRKEEIYVHADQFKDGVAVFSIKTQTAIVPVAIYSKPKAFRRNTMVYGEQISPKYTEASKENIAEYSKEIADAINNLLPKETN